MLLLAHPTGFLYGLGSFLPQAEIGVPVSMGNFFSQDRAGQQWRLEPSAKVGGALSHRPPAALQVFFPFLLGVQVDDALPPYAYPSTHLLPIAHAIVHPHYAFQSETSTADVHRHENLQ
ncbi:hypothetical protein EMIT0P44_200016 [Pseudomonas sp. IT-P44]